jgi:hypothetical protein
MTNHFSHDGDQNQQVEDQPEFEAVSSLPTVNVYYKYPSQKNDLSRKIRDLEDRIAYGSRLQCFLSRSDDQNLLDVAQDAAQELNSLSKMFARRKAA